MTHNRLHLTSTSVLGLIIAVTLYSCETRLKLPKTEHPNSYAINSLINPDSLFSCYVHKITSPEALEFPFVEDAIVKIIDTQTGDVIAELLHVDSGLYTTIHSKPLEGMQYSLSVKTEDGQTISGTTTVPQKVDIDTTWFYENYKGEFSNRLIFMDFTDVSDTEFYEISTYARRYNGEGEADTFWANTFIESSDPSIADYNTFGESKFSVQLPGESFINETRSTSFVIHGSYHVRYKNKLILQLKSVSYEYYQCVRAWPLHREEQSLKEPNLLEPTGGILGFINNPVPMYSNIEGGVGIFAAYSSTYKTAYSVNSK